MALINLEGIPEAGPLLTLAVVLLAGWAFGTVAKRLHVPSITGQIVAGVLLARVASDFLGEASLDALHPLTNFALGLMAITVGAHLNLRRLRNAGKRLGFLFLAEATITPVIVFAAVRGVGGYALGLEGADTPTAVLLATCAIATAPATIVAIVKETNSKGVFVKTLVAAVALNNLACIALFEIARALTHDAPSGEATWVDGLAEPGRQLMLALGLGGLIAVAMVIAGRLISRSEILATAAALALLLASGLASLFDASPLLTCLFLGFVQTNLSTARDKLVDEVFADFQPVILIVFFTLAGMHLSFESAAAAGVLAVLLFGGRMAGKLLAGRVAMTAARAPRYVRRNLGLALVPQAGVAVGLVVLLQEDPRHAQIAEIFSAVVLTVVTANEIVGPILTRIALGRAGEIGKDRMRLLDFIQEENIVTGFQAADKHEAIERLVDLMIRSHHLDNIDRETLLNSVLTREAQASTCLGGGLSVPHCILPREHPMVGVMGISREGIDLPTPDKAPVHCMVLLGTSADERDRHLQVLAALARTIGSDPVFGTQVFNAKSPAHASVLLHGEESEDFNYFLEGDDD
jgi:Kef-type K+ transport system membrane component KefB/mannitol/fructose-specific phosphotransferase system IIA component